MAKANMNIDWGNNLTEESQGLDNYSLEEDLSNPEALNFGSGISKPDKKTKTKGRKGNKEITNNSQLRERQDYQKLDKGDRGYK